MEQSNPVEYKFNPILSAIASLQFTDLLILGIITGAVIKLTYMGDYLTGFSFLMVLLLFFANHCFKFLIDMQLTAMRVLLETTTRQHALIEWYEDKYGKKEDDPS